MQAFRSQPSNRPKVVDRRTILLQRYSPSSRHVLSGVLSSTGREPSRDCFGTSQICTSKPFRVGSTCPLWCNDVAHDSHQYQQDDWSSQAASRAANGCARKKIILSFLVRQTEFRRRQQQLQRYRTLRNSRPTRQRRKYQLCGRNAQRDPLLQVD